MKLQKIKNFDYDNYICAIFADKTLWDDIATILEFNIEIATIKNKVTDPTLGLIRLQWWRDAIEDIFSNKLIKNHQVIICLKELSEKHKLNKDKFLKIINAREKDFLENPFNNFSELIEYIENTAFGLNDIIAYILNAPEDFKAQNKDISVAWGITAIIRAYTKNLAKGRKIIPNEVSLQELINYAEGKISLINANNKYLAPILLKKSVARFYLNQFKKRDFNYKSQIKSLEGLGVLKLAFNYYLGRY